jgi:hypothetical protein
MWNLYCVSEEDRIEGKIHTQFTVWLCFNWKNKLEEQQKVELRTRIKLVNWYSWSSRKLFGSNCDENLIIVEMCGHVANQLWRQELASHHWSSTAGKFQSVENSLCMNFALQFVVNKWRPIHGDNNVKFPITLCHFCISHFELKNSEINVYYAYVFSSRRLLDSEQNSAELDFCNCYSETVASNKHLNVTRDKLSNVP